MYTTRTKPWVRAPVGCAPPVRAPPHRELKIAAPVQLCILVVKNITPEWLAGMFDGDGGITVIHNKKAGRSRLEISITQEKCPALLKAIQALYPGTMQYNPHRLKWVAANIIPAVYKALGSHLILKKQKLNTLLQHLFKVDITKDPIVGAGCRGAFTCPNPTKGWTAEHWRDYLHEPLSAWSR